MNLHGKQDASMPGNPASQPGACATDNCCGHDHHHTHDCCGHEHSHDGHHDHAHHHDSGRTVPWKGGTMTIKSYEHEGAIVCSAQCENSSSDYADEGSYLGAVMQEIARWVVAQGGFIGHIKASLENTEHKSLSVTQEELMVTSSHFTTRIEVAAIVFGVQPSALEDKFLQTF